jgi:hypothetical protein
MTGNVPFGECSLVIVNIDKRGLGAKTNKCASPYAQKAQAHAVHVLNNAQSLSDPIILGLNEGHNISVLHPGPE